MTAISFIFTFGHTLTSSLYPFISHLRIYPQDDPYFSSWSFNLNEVVLASFLLIYYLSSLLYILPNSLSSLFMPLSHDFIALFFQSFSVSQSASLPKFLSLFLIFTHLAILCLMIFSWLLEELSHIKLLSSFYRFFI